ncbi:MAG: HU family DNA-binding protein [Clostridia bacterium]|nr:HU family DNA-binding protein [Clostridia bacterium]
MNKQQFIKAFAEKAQFTQKDAGIAFEAMAETIVEALKAGEKIQIAGFGTYELKERAAREGINPLTKQKVSIPACKVPTFKFGNSFKDTINQ